MADHPWLLETEPCCLRSYALHISQMQSVHSARAPEMQSCVIYWDSVRHSYLLARYLA